MILFKVEHIEPILRGRKTQTRRMWDDEKPRVKVGNVYQARTRMLDKNSTFAYLRVTGLRWGPLDDITENDAHKEGYESVEEYKKAFVRIYKKALPGGYWPTMEMVWVVDFEVVSKEEYHDV